jgi:hypothetical protein
MIARVSLVSDQLWCRDVPLVLGLGGMAAHSVKMLVEHPLNVGSLGVEFEVRKGGKLLGKLQISQTSIDWTPAKARNPRKATWQEFGDWMEDKGARRNGPARAAVVVTPAEAEDGIEGDTEGDAPLDDESAGFDEVYPAASSESETSGIGQKNNPSEWSF